MASITETNGVRQEEKDNESHDSSSMEQTQKDDVPDEDYTVSGAKLHIIIFGLSLAVFLMALDMSILATAIPLITAKFQSTADIGWYVSAYALSISAFQPLSGKLYTNFSMKWTFIALFVLFEIGSAISGAATSSNMLIVGRFISGMGAAGIFSGTLSIVATVVTLRLRGLYTGIVSANFGIALLCGPLLGGAFTQHVSWRWVFYINIPLGVVTIAALTVFFHPPTRPVENDTIRERIWRLDLPGVAVFVPAIFMILLALQWGGVKYPWGSGRIIGLFVAGVVVLIFFGVYQWWKGDLAMIPPSILMNRTVLLASLTAMCGLGAMSLFGLWMAEWFQVVKNASPVKSGVNILPAMLGQIVSTLFAGGMSSFLGYYNPFLITGSAFLSIGSGLFTIMGVDTKTAEWAGFEVFYGLGAGMFVTGPIMAAQTALSPKDIPIGMATVSFFQMFGSALATGLSQTIFNEQLAKQLSTNVPDADVGKLLAAGTSAIRHVTSPAQLPGVLQSYNVAILDPFYLASSLSAVAFVCAVCLPWISTKSKATAPAAV